MYTTYRSFEKLPIQLCTQSIGKLEGRITGLLEKGNIASRVITLLTSLIWTETILRRCTTIEALHDA